MIEDGRIASRSLRNTLACPRYAAGFTQLRICRALRLLTVWTVYTFRRKVCQFLEVRIPRHKLQQRRGRPRGHGSHHNLLFVGVFEWLASLDRILGFRHQRRTSR